MTTQAVPMGYYKVTNNGIDSYVQNPNFGSGLPGATSLTQSQYQQGLQDSIAKLDSLRNPAPGYTGQMFDQGLYSRYQSELGQLQAGKTADSGYSTLDGTIVDNNSLPGIQANIANGTASNSGGQINVTPAGQSQYQAGAVQTPVIPTTGYSPTSGGQPTIPTASSALSTNGPTPTPNAAYFAGAGANQSLPGGSAYTPPSGNVTGSSMSGTGSFASNSSAPTAPVSSSAASGATDNTTLAGLLKKYQDALQPTGTMLDLQKQAADLEAARRTADTDVNTQGINVGAKSGYQANIDSQSLNKENAIQAQYGIAKDQQSATAQGAQAALEIAKGTPLSLGQNLVDPLTGQTIAEGQSYSAKQGSANVLALSKAYPDAGILPTDDPNIAAQKASQSQSFIAKFGNQSAQWNSSTQQFEVINTNRLGSTNPGGSYSGNPNGSNGASSVFGTQPQSASGGSLQQGSSGQSVQALQQFLVSQGYMSAADVATGSGTYGPKTAAAVAAFQQANGVNTSGGGSGVFGPQTQAAAAAKGLSLAGTITSGSNFGGGNGTSGNTNFGSQPSASSSTSNPLSRLSAGAYQLVTTGEYPSKAGSAQNSAYLNEARAAIPGFNPTVAKANASAITDQTKQMANITSALSSADNTFNLLLSSASKAGINTSTVGAINAINRASQQGLLSNAEVAKFNSSIETVKTEYAQVLGRGGEVTDAVRKQASDVVDKDLSIGTLAQLQQRLVQEGQIAIQARQDEITKLASGGSSPGGSAGGSDYDAYLKAIGVTK